MDLIRSIIKLFSISSNCTAYSMDLGNTKNLSCISIGVGTGGEGLDSYLTHPPPRFCKDRHACNWRPKHFCKFSPLPRFIYLLPGLMMYIQLTKQYDNTFSDNLNIVSVTVQKIMSTENSIPKDFMNIHNGNESF